MGMPHAFKRIRLHLTRSEERPPVRLGMVMT
jgi:hypothetical protein